MNIIARGISKVEKETEKLRKEGRNEGFTFIRNPLS